MLSFGRWLILLFVRLFDLLCFRLWLCFGCLLLFRLLLLFYFGRLIFNGLVNKFKFAGNGRVYRLVAYGLIPSSDVGVLPAPLLAEDILKATRDDACCEQIG